MTMMSGAQKAKLNNTPVRKNPLTGALTTFVKKVVQVTSSPRCH